MMSSKIPLADPSTQLKLPGNPEHGGVAGMILFLLIAAVIGFYYGLYRTLPVIFGGRSSDFILIAGFLSLFLGVGFVALLDPLIKRLLPSGYWLRLEGSKVILERPRAAASQIDLAQEHGAVRWYFRMTGYPRYGRERQIRKGFFCVACELQQEDERIVVHAFVSPFKAAQGNADFLRGFHEIDMDEIYDTGLGKRIRQWRSPGNRPDIPPSLIVSDDGKYWLAERHRWQEGVELSPKAFEQFVAAIKPYQ